MSETTRFNFKKHRVFKNHSPRTRPHASPALQYFETDAWTALSG